MSDFTGGESRPEEDTGAGAVISVAEATRSETHSEMTEVATTFFINIRTHILDRKNCILVRVNSNCLFRIRFNDGRQKQITIGLINVGKQ